jgi:hypothetical protein
MHYHMEAFKKVDVIATPTTGYDMQNFFYNSSMYMTSKYNIFRVLIKF